MSDLRMPDLNKVIVAGRLTRDPELKYTNANKAYCRVGVANSRRFRRDGGDWQEETNFIDVTVWGPMAEYVGKLAKGRPVLVEGRLRSSEWEDKQTGQKRSRLEISADRVTPLDWEDRPGGPGGGGGGGAREGGYQGGGSGGSGGGGYQQRPPQQQAPSNSRGYDDEPPPEDDIPF